MDWSLRACGRRGHVTFAPTEPQLRARLHAMTSGGEAWRCLRCADFVVGPPHGAGPADSAPLVLRGRALRDATVLRVLAAERLLRALLLFGGVYAVLRFEGAQLSLGQRFARALPAARPLAQVLHINLDHSKTVARIQRLLHSSPHTLTWVAVGLAGYGALELVEAVGLALLRRWGEYVAAVGTAVFLPVELHELVKGVTTLRLGAFGLNLAAVVYLLVTKRLFGLRGGRAAFEAERRSESLLEVEAAAAASSAG